MDLQRSNTADVIWGAAAIGKAMGKTPRQAFHLLESGQLKGARKIGARWVITHRALMANFEVEGSVEGDITASLPKEHPA